MQNIATGASPWLSVVASVSTVGATDSLRFFRPYRAQRPNNTPGLPPGGYTLSPLCGSIRMQLSPRQSFPNSCHSKRNLDKSAGAQVGTLARQYVCITPSHSIPLWCCDTFGPLLIPLAHLINTPLIGKL